MIWWPVQLFFNFIPLVVINIYLRMPSALAMVVCVGVFSFLVEMVGWSVCGSCLVRGVGA